MFDVWIVRLFEGYSWGRVDRLTLGLMTVGIRFGIQRSNQLCSVRELSRRYMRVKSMNDAL